MAAKVRVAPVWPVSPDPVRYSKGRRKAMSDKQEKIEAAKAELRRVAIDAWGQYEDASEGALAAYHRRLAEIEEEGDE